MSSGRENVFSRLQSAASLSRLLRVITRPLREAFLRLPGGKSSRKLDRIPLTPLASLVSASVHPPPPSKTCDNVSAFCRPTVLWKHADSTSELKKEGGGGRGGGDRGSRALSGSWDGIAFNSRVFGRCSSSFWGGGDEDFSSRDLSFELLLASLSLAQVFDSRGTEWDLCVNAMCASSKNSIALLIPFETENFHDFAILKLGSLGKSRNLYYIDRLSNFRKEKEFRHKGKEIFFRDRIRERLFDPMVSMSS